MEASQSYYNFDKSIERIDEILIGEDASYTNQEGIPSRDLLTFTNGFYVQITVLFVDLRGSKELAENHTRPVLAKMYRSYISEVVAVLKSNSCINEIYIEGDGVWAVFNTTKKDEVQSVVVTASLINSLVNVLNVKFKKRGYSAIKAGIGVEDGTSLYIKAGYKGSGINEVVWIGRAVGQAAKLCNEGSRGSAHPIMISEIVYSNCGDRIKGFFDWDDKLECYTGNVINSSMEEWVENNG
jgi:class 3 adenylate cyclase